VPGGKMALAMELILTPLIKEIITKKRAFDELRQPDLPI
jgi:phosphoribulokinase